MYQNKTHYSKSDLTNRRSTSGAINRQWNNDYYNRGVGLQDHSNAQYSRTHNNNANINRRGCYNCGEYNHRQSNCRYDHKIRCNVCQEYGHKSRFCNYNFN